MESQSIVRFLTIKEAAQFVKLHPNSIRNAIAQGRLKAYRFGRNIRINEQELLNLLTPYRGGEFGVWNGLTHLDELAPKQRPDSNVGGGRL